MMSDLTEEKVKIARATIDASFLCETEKLELIETVLNASFKDQIGGVFKDWQVELRDNKLINLEQ